MSVGGRRETMTGEDRPAPPPVGTEIEVAVERIVPGGLGLARHGGRIVLVERAAPGDVVRVKIERRQGQTAFSVITAIVTPSPDRIPDLFPEIATAGADFQHLSPGAEIDAKRAILADCLRRIAGLTEWPEIATVPSPELWHYRAVAEWHVSDDRRAVGPLMRGTHRVVDLAHDPLVLPALDAALGNVRRDIFRGAPVAPRGAVRAVVGDRRVGIVPPPRGAAPDVLTTTVLGRPFRLDARCFLQVNPAALPMLIEHVLDGLPAHDGPAFDLYGGIGLFATHLAANDREVTLVESHEVSAAYSRQNLDDAGLHRVKVRTTTVESFLTGWPTSRRPAIVLLDPPRAGAGQAVVDSLLRLRPRHIAYVSCDPATLARDLRPLLETGYVVDRLSVVDMFPRTHHVESVVHLAAPAA